LRRLRALADPERDPRGAGLPGDHGLPPLPVLLPLGPTQLDLAPPAQGEPDPGPADPVDRPEAPGDGRGVEPGAALADDQGPATGPAGRAAPRLRRRSAARLRRGDRLDVLELHGRGTQRVELPGPGRGRRPGAARRRDRPGLTPGAGGTRAPATRLKLHAARGSD